MNRTLFDPPEGDSPTRPATHAPLAERLRPRTLDEVLGQGKVVGPGAFLRRAVEEDRVPSLLFWGPPGCGKTTLARILARETQSRFVPFSAVTSGIKEVKAVMAEAERFGKALGGETHPRTLIFIDEIHRFNRAQQDAFLPYVESGEVVLVGATTENPSFSLNAALLSRCRVVVLAPLSPQTITEVLCHALQEEERGLGGAGVSAGDDALATITQLAGGDARKALNLLELVVTDAACAEVPAPGGKTVTAETVRAIAQRKVLLYDKSGEEHFNLISALHKSLRESDPDAALYWLGRMLEAGEDPLYLARRMVRFASEDVGLADPQALVQANAAREAYHNLGSPEGELALAQACLYLALAPKSNYTYRAYGAVRRTIAERPADPVPPVIRNAPTQLMKDVGYGKGYVYAHDTEGGVGGIDCLPESLQGSHFYEPSDQGLEKRLAERLASFTKRRDEARRR